MQVGIWNLFSSAFFNQWNTITYRTCEALFELLHDSLPALGARPLDLALRLLAVLGEDLVDHLLRHVAVALQQEEVHSARRPATRTVLEGIISLNNYIVNTEDR